MRRLLAALLFSCLFVSVAHAKGPSSDALRQLIVKQLEQRPNYETGDLLSQGAVKQIFVTLRRKGYVVKDHQLILKRVLPDNDFLIRQTSDDKGRAFLRKIEKLNGGIDRLDRLARIPNGEASVNDLIRKVPNGHEWIEAMVTTKRGRRLGERLSNSSQISNFNESTKRIYTVDALVKAMSGKVKRLKPARKS